MKKILCILLIMTCLTLAFPLNAAADSNMISITNSSAVVINVDDFDTKVAFEQAIQNALDNPNVLTVKVYGDDTQLATLPDSLTITPTNASPTVYDTRNVTTTNNVRGTGTDYLGKLQIWPGDTPTLAVSGEKVYTFSLSAGATYRTLSMLLGWSGTTTSSVSVKYPTTCPYTYNNHSVKYMYLTAWPVYTVKKYDLYLTVPGYIYNQYQGRGTAKKPMPNTFQITKTYVYN